MFESKHFEFSDIPDLSGKTAVITGASTGIGRVCALEMARKNCHVIFACRNKEKTLSVIEAIQNETGNQNLEFMEIDLMSLQSVQKFITEYKNKHNRLHILMNNAGLMGATIITSKDDLDSQFATNHLAHFYLTTQLLPIIKQSAPSRIVNVSSLAHKVRYGTLDFEDINKKENHGRAINYGVTKAANILFSNELAKRLEAEGTNNVYVNSNHPGIVKSELIRNWLGLGIFAKIYNALIPITTEKGALTQLYLATSPEIEENNIKGEYYVPYAKLSKASADATSEKNAIILWDYSESLLKEKISGYEGAGI